MINRIINNEFWKNIATLLSASLFAQLIPFIALPVLQKWFFSPSDFGLLAIYTSVSLLLASVSAFKYELAIVNADTEEESQKIFKGSIIIVLLFTLVVSVFIAIFKTPIANLFNITELGNYILLIPLSVLFVGIYEVLNYWNNRKKNFKTIASSKISKAISSESSKLAFGNYGIGSGLIIGRIIGEFISMLYLLVKFLRNEYSKFTNYNISEVKQALKKHYRFPLFSMPSVFVGNTINVVFLALFSRYFGTDYVGILGVSVIYVAVAFGIMSQAFSQVFFKEIHLKNTRKELLSFYLKNAAILSIISAIVIIIVQLIPSQLLVKLIGEQWQEMMPTLKVLVYAYGAQFITSSLSFIYIRLNKQKTMLIFDILHLILIWISIFLSYTYFGSFMSAIIAYTIAQIVYYSIAFLAAIYFIQTKEEL